MNEKTHSKIIRSGAYCKCGHCGYESYAYGTPYGAGKGHDAGISAPWCQQCGINSKLTVVKHNE